MHLNDPVEVDSVTYIHGNPEFRLRDQLLLDPKEGVEYDSRDELNDMIVEQLLQDKIPVVDFAAPNLIMEY